MRETKGSAGRVSSTRGPVVLQQPAVAHDCDAITQTEGFIHVVGHEQDRGAEPSLDVEQVILASRG